LRRSLTTMALIYTVAPCSAGTLLLRMEWLEPRGGGNQVGELRNGLASQPGTTLAGFMDTFHSSSILEVEEDKHSEDKSTWCYHHTWTLLSDTDPECTYQEQNSADVSHWRRASLTWKI